jgi:hypothetical protein
LYSKYAYTRALRFSSYFFLVQDHDEMSAALAGFSKGLAGFSKGSLKRVINFPLPWADKIREAKKRKAAAAEAARKSKEGDEACAVCGSETEDWEAILGKGKVLVC